MNKNIYTMAAEGQPDQIKDRREIHSYAELSMDLPQTVAYVEKRLGEMGYTPQRVGKSGITAVIGNPEGKTILLRADMDALPIPEETGLSFANTKGTMHACGHDLHTASLLGAAQILKDQENTLAGQVKLLFQPGEETMQGALDMLAHGILENPTVDSALAIHVVPTIPTGQIATREGNVMSSTDMFKIHIQGKGGHGSAPQACIDPIVIGVQIHLALQQLISRETNFQKGAALTVGCFQAGVSANIIPDTGTLQGTLRTLNTETRDYLVQRIKEITGDIAKAYRGSATVEIFASAAPLYNDPPLTEEITQYIEELQSDIKLFTTQPSSGSEDFALIAEKVPSVMLMVGAKAPEVEQPYAAHHPKVMFDEGAIAVSAAVYAQVAIRWLGDHLN